MYSLVLALIYLAFVSLGLRDSLIGSGWPAICEMLSVSPDYLSYLTMLISGCTVVSSLLSAKLVSKFGTRNVTIVSISLLSFALFGFSFSERFWVLLLFAIPYGFGAGAVDAALNNYMALCYPARHMNWLHCFWGIGAIIGPIAVGRALAGPGWQIGFRAMAFVQAGIALLLIVTGRAWNLARREGQAPVETKALSIGTILKLRGVPFLLIGFFAYYSLEATAMNWASTYLVEGRGIDAVRAATYGSLYFIGMTAGRLLSGFVADKIGDRRLIRYGCTVLFAGIVLLAIPVSSDFLSIAGLIAIGAGCGPIYPAVIHATPLCFGSENSGAVIGIQTACAFIGSTFVPPLYGWLGDLVGYSVFPFFYLLFFIPMLLFIEKTFRVTEKTRPAA